ncbi:MAG: lactoylglutathione lyase [Ponticaulis sp.]|nr:lactoylglutathione lyase [Ponticaulis sp.]|tara:strand:+ start:16499 stop:16969 length:471 start_codon:yes stop_codon:yes gene_type:complete
MSVEFLHSMIRVSDLEKTIRFFTEGLGLKEIRRIDNSAGRFTLAFLASPEDLERAQFDENGTPLKAGVPMVELTYNWDPEEYSGGRNFGHLAYQVGNIYEVVEHLAEMGVTINRPPRDGHMAFVRSPDGISIELLQKGDALPPKEPWASAENIGSW